MNEASMSHDVGSIPSRGVQLHSPPGFGSGTPEQGGQGVVFTGGGTTGHVTKNQILLEALKKLRPEVRRYYLGLKTGKEAELISADLAEFHAISSGKLRRYLALETIPDFFRFVYGIWQSYWLLRRLKPKLVFSSGGFVALPVATAAWLRKIPVFTHETDSYPGLANRLIGKMATKIFLGFESAGKYFESPTPTPAHLKGEKIAHSSSRVVQVGNPVSPRLFDGSRERALKKLGFSAEKKVLLVMGGSQGAQQINELIWEILPKLMEEGWQLIHLTGKGKDWEGAKGTEGAEENPPSNPSNRPYLPYHPFDYVTTDYPDFLCAADLVISRAGGNSLAEIEALGKTALLIPLPLPAAAGDHQRKNAEEMLKKHADWKMLLNPASEVLLEAIRTTSAHKQGVSKPDILPQELILQHVDQALGREPFAKA